jgi:hypothetical protein
VSYCDEGISSAPLWFMVLLIFLWFECVVILNIFIGVEACCLVVSHHGHDFILMHELYGGYSESNLCLF